MPTTLLTFLGRVPNNGEYHKTAYGFPDGSQSEPVTFFGWPLQNWVKAERIVIMGTAGSMWDQLFEHNIRLEPEAEDAWMKLISAVRSGSVETELLWPLQKPLSEHLDCDARLEIIPYCRKESEQVNLLSTMARHVDNGDSVHMDITHGFRHLPMIALLSALYLKTMRQAKIEGIWYGPYDPDTKDAAVHNLVGLLKIAGWMEALHTYDKDGDYGVFSPLLGPVGDLLRQAAFFERTTNPVRGRSELRAWAGLADSYPSEDPAAALFRDELNRRISWHHHPDRASWEKQLAGRYLKQGDYLRAAIYGMEAVISAEIQKRHEQVDDYENRDIAKDELRNNREGFRTLSNLRNALTHGVRKWDQNIERAMGNEQILKNTLKSLLTQLSVL
jgi:CRISPR-associated Csx2 family protein